MAFSVISNDTIGETQNVSLLIPTGTYSREVLEAFALERQATLCKGLCNIHLYDDSMACALHHTELAVGHASSLSDADPTARDRFIAFTEANHLFIADHFLGSLAGEPQWLWYYPYKELDQVQLRGQA